MFKFVVLSCLVSVAFAGLVHHAPAAYVAAPVAHHYTEVQHVPQVKTVVEPHVSVVETPTINHVGSVVKNVPTGVSHHSSSVVHSAANIVEPVYAHGVQKSIVSHPVAKQVVEHVAAAPAVHYAAAPAIHYAAAPAVHHSYASAPIAYAAAPVAHHSYVAAPAVHYAPKALSYSSYPAHTYAAAYPAAHSAYAHY